MLIGYFLKEVSPDDVLPDLKVSHDDIFPDLENPTRFASSRLRQVPMERLAMLCEASFYDALLAKAEGNTDRLKSSLEKAVATDYRSYYEYGMAKFMLDQLNQKQR
jgi:hypothetical protein